MDDDYCRLRYLAASNANNPVQAATSWVRLFAVLALLMCSLKGLPASCGALPLLLFTTATAALTFVHARPSLIRSIDDANKMPTLARLLSHMLNTVGHIGVNLPATLETIGAACAVIAVFGFASAHLTTPFLVAALASLAVYVAGMLVNLTTHAGLYTWDPPPNRLLLALHLALPALGSAIALTLLFCVEGSARNLPASTRWLLAVPPFLGVYLFRWMFDVTLDAGVVTMQGAVEQERGMIVGETHSLISNPISQVRAQLDREQVDLEAARHHARLLSAHLPELQHLGRKGSKAGTFGSLVEAVAAKSGAKEAIHCDQASASLQFGQIDYGVARIPLVDLIDNAIKSGASLALSRGGR